MNCAYEQQIGEYIEGTLGADAAAAFDAHLSACPGCAAAITDLRTIQATARVLEPRTPPAALWSRIANAVDAEPRPRAWGVRAWPMRAWDWRPLAAAAVLLLAAGLGWLAWQPQSEPAATATTVAPPVEGIDNDPAPNLVESVEMEIKLAEDDFARTIQGLETIRQAESGALDPDTAEVVQASLTVIDEAIGETRAALQTEPTNTLAQDSLFEALQSKVSLLQDTIALINEMRKGNPEGTARIVSEMTP